jgi:hypothetical protein
MNATESSTDFSTLAARHDRKPMTIGFFGKCAQEIIEAIRGVRSTNAALEARIVALEARPIGAIDAGVFEPGRTYARGDGTTWDGHYWIAQVETSEPPGEGCRSWRLAVRRGKVGREGKPCRCQS